MQECICSSYRLFVGFRAVLLVSHLFVAPNFLRLQDRADNSTPAFYASATDMCCEGIMLSIRASVRASCKHDNTGIG